jgi:hypothetical protein
MIGPIVLWQAVLFFILGAFLGQRFVHLHPIQSAVGNPGA